jgi:L-amino acid N-acyltransferase YncA
VNARIVAARPEHLVEVAAIYADAARTSVSTFDLDGAPIQYWQDKLAAPGPGDHFIVAVATDTPDAGAATDGAVLGFAYSGWFRPRPAYGRTRETSIYLHRDARGQGLGRALYRDLLDRLRGDGMHLAVAVIAQPNPASVALHEGLGFDLVGTFSEIGEKFGRYVDTRWYQLRLN